MHKYIETRIMTPEGAKLVPGKMFDFCNLFSIVMPEFGVFGVTHTDSGCSLIMGIEREKNAEEHLLKLHKASMEAGIAQNANIEQFVSRAKMVGKLNSLGNLSINEYCSIFRNRYFGKEFPWEYGDNCPHIRVDKLIKEIEGRTAQQCA